MFCRQSNWRSHKRTQVFVVWSFRFPLYYYGWVPRTSRSSEWNWMHHGTVAPQLQDARVELRGLPVSWEGWWWSHSRTPCISQFNRHNLCSIRCMCVQYHTGHPCHIKLNYCCIISCNNENCWARWYQLWSWIGEQSACWSNVGRLTLVWLLFVNEIKWEICASTNIFKKVTNTFLTVIKKRQLLFSYWTGQ